MEPKQWGGGTKSRGCFATGTGGSLTQGFFSREVGFSDLVGGARCEFSSQFKGAHANIPKIRAFIYLASGDGGRGQKSGGVARGPVASQHASFREFPEIFFRSGAYLDAFERELAMNTTELTRKICREIRGGGR
jgi:hypothetical protein